MENLGRVTIEKKEEGDILIILIRGKFTKNYAQSFVEQIVAEVSPKQKKILVKIEEFDSINGFALRFLHFLDKKLQELNGKFVVCVSDSSVREIIQVSGLSQSLIVVESMEKGMEELK